VAAAWKLLAREGVIAQPYNEVAIVRDHAEEESHLLAALRLVWAGFYQISATAGGWEAWRMDGSGAVEAATVRELNAAIREDWPKYSAGVVPL
jgi:hypothetical protein